MKREFQIEKQGVTNGMVTIVSRPGESFNRTEKIKFYLSLDYKVFDMDGKQILTA